MRRLLPWLMGALLLLLPVHPAAAAAGPEPMPPPLTGPAHSPSPPSAPVII